MQIKLQESNLTEYVANATGLLENLPEYYTTAALPVKQQIIGSIYPEKHVFDNGAYRTKSINEVVELICRTSKDYEEIKKKIAFQIWKAIRLGDRVRIQT